MANSPRIETEDDDCNYEAEMSRVRDKDATVIRLGRDQEPGVYRLFTSIATEAHRRLLMDPATRRLGVADGALPSFTVFRKLNWHGDEATGKVPRGRVTISSEREFLLTGYELSFEINAQVWDACGDAERAYIVDERWEEVTAQLDPEGHQRMDANGRRLLSKAKPDVATFSSVVGRRGPVFVEIERLVQAAASSGVVQTAFDFREQRAPAPVAVEVAPIPPADQIVANEIELARAKRLAMEKV